MESLFPISVPILMGTKKVQQDPGPEFTEPIPLGKFSVQFSRHGLRHLVQDIRQRRFDDWQWFLLALQADSITWSSGVLVSSWP